MICFTVTDVVRFDNTYSWTRSKTIHYIIEVLEAVEPPDSAIMGETGDIYKQDGASEMYTSFAINTQNSSTNDGHGNQQNTADTNI